MQFGRKSEKLDHQIEQLELQLKDLQADEAEAAREMPAANQAPRKKSVRRPLPERLPRDGRVYPPTADACRACGGGLRPLGEDVAEQLEFVPASFRVIRDVRHRSACSWCDAIVQAPAPSRPIERGIAGPGLLAHILVGGAIEIDNSAAERALRGVAIARRSYLFSGADSGGVRAAAIYSLIGTIPCWRFRPERGVTACCAR